MIIGGFDHAVTEFGRWRADLDVVRGKIGEETGTETKGDARLGGEPGGIAVGSLRDAAGDKRPATGAAGDNTHQQHENGESDKFSAHETGTGYSIVVWMPDRRRK